MLSAIANALLVFSLAACLLAFVKGGAAERLGAAVILGNLLVGVADEVLLHQQLIILCDDAIAALILLVVAVRFASFWLGAVMLLYALQFALHATYMVLDRPRDTLHVILNNADFFAVSVCLAAGTILTWRRQRRAALGGPVAGTL